MRRDTLVTLYNLCQSALIFSGFAILDIAMKNNKAAYIMLGLIVAELLGVCITIGVILWRNR